MTIVSIDAKAVLKNQIAAHFQIEKYMNCMQKRKAGSFRARRRPGHVWQAAAHPVHRSCAWKHRQGLDLRYSEYCRKPKGQVDGKWKLIRYSSGLEGRDPGPDPTFPEGHGYTSLWQRQGNPSPFRIPSDGRKNGGPVLQGRRPG